MLAANDFTQMDMKHNEKQIYNLQLGQVLNRFMFWFETHSSCILTRGITLSSLSGTAIAAQEFFAELFLPRGEQWIKAYKRCAFKNIAIWLTLLFSGASRGTWPWSSSAWLQPAGIGAFKINLNILFVAIFVFLQYSYSYNIYICAIFVFVVSSIFFCGLKLKTCQVSNHLPKIETFQRDDWQFPSVIKTTTRSSEMNEAPAIKQSS